MKNMSADRRMIKIAMAAPYLAREEEHDLAVRWKHNDDRGARNQIAMAHICGRSPSSSTARPVIRWPGSSLTINQSQKCRTA